METFNGIRHRKVNVNGINMHVAEKGDKGSPIVLFLHGFPELWYSWRYQIMALSALGYHAVAPDMRGYGDTDAPTDFHSYTYGDIVGDLVAVIDELGVEQVFVVGHDWGAMIAWWLCLFRPDRVKPLVNLSVAFSSRDPKTKPVDALHDAYGDDYKFARFQEILGRFYHVVRNESGIFKVLRGAEGFTWNVIAEKSTDGNGVRRICMKEGWKDFILDNDIEVGDTLIMYFKGNGVFHTRIFAFHGKEKTYPNVVISRGAMLTRRLPLSSSELEVHLSMMQQKLSDPSFKCTFRAPYISQGSLIVPVPFARIHFKEMQACTVVLVRYRLKQWCAELHIARQGNVIIACSLRNGVNMFYEEQCIISGVGAVVVYRRGYPLLF